MSDHTELGRDTKGQSMTRGPQFFQSIISKSATLSWPIYIAYTLLPVKQFDILVYLLWSVCNHRANKNSTFTFNLTL